MHELFFTVKQLHKCSVCQWDFRKELFNHALFFLLQISFKNGGGGEI